MIYSFKFFAFHTFLALLSLVGFSFLLKVKKYKTSSKLRKLFHVSSDKSSSNAVLLGGLVISFVNLVGVGILMLRYYGSPNEKVLFGAWVSGHIVLTILGYFDDRYELRASFKLVGQFIACFLFSVIACMTIQSNVSAIYLAIFQVWGLGVVNGTNLLDGIDTISIKLSLTTYAVFFALGLGFNIPTLPVLSILFSIPLVVFYIFNKEPSRIHLGEIGGTTIGLSYLLLASITFNGMYAEKSFYDFSNAICLSLLPLHLPMVELGVSFIRRIYNGKSPFIGDRHHIHYIFRDFYDIGATRTATLYALGHFSICAVMFFTSLFSPVISFFSGGIIYLMCFLSVGKEIWSKGHGDKNVSFFHIFRSVKTKEINIINNSDIENFHMEVISESYKKDDDEIKKAS